MPPADSYLPHVLLVLPHQLPSATIYIIKPLKELARQRKLVFQQTTELEVTPPQIRSSDLVLFSRNMEPASDWILEECLANKIPTVYDLDDNFWEVPLDLMYASTFRAPERIQQLERYLAHVDFVRVYSQYLKDRVSQFNRNVIVAPPCVDFSLVPLELLPKKDGILRITYATGRGGGDALIDLFADDLRRLLDDHPGQIEMYWWGEIPPQFVEHPASRLVGIIHDYDEYLRFLSTSGFDIGLAPLTPTSFNLSKTNTKFRDYGAAWVAGIYSNVDVYSDVAHEYTGMLADDRPGGWLEALTRLTDNEQLRHYIQTSAHQFVYNHYRQELAEEAWLDLIFALIKTRRKMQLAPGLPPMGGVKRKVNLALGCQYPPPAGFIGIDAQPYPGVSVIADLNRPLPLASDCVDLLLADHTLDRLASPQEALKEVYRISCHTAQLCIIAPYSPPGQDTPEGRTIRYLFNEETPCYWTDQPLPAYRNPYLAPEVTPGPDRPASLPVDIRCLDIEFFYYPEYLNETEHNRRKLRKELPQVCDQLLYRCLVIKQTIDPLEIDRILQQSPGYEPERIQIRRLRDVAQSLKAELEGTRLQFQLYKTASSGEAVVKAAVDQAVQAALEAAEADFQGRLEQLKADAQGELHRVVTESQAEIDQLKEQAQMELDQLNAQSQAEINLVKAQAQAAMDQLKAQSRAETEQLKAGAQAEIERVRTDAQAEIERVRADAQVEVERVQSMLATKTDAFEQQMYRARHAVGELDVHRNRRVFRFIERIFDRADLSKELPTTFSHLLDDSHLYQKDLGGYCLQASPNLQRIAHRSYVIELDQPDLCEVSFAFVVDLLPSTGYIGIDILSPDERVLAHATRPAEQIDPDQPVKFEFQPVQSMLQGRHELRIFCRDVDVPVRLLEWRKYGPLGLGPVRTRGFCGFGFGVQE